MITNLKHKLNLLILIFFLGPAGFGLSFIPGLLTFDLPKIIPFVISIVLIIKFNFKKLDNISFLFLIFISLHFLSVFYASNIKISSVNFISHLLLFYPGFFLSYFIINSEKDIKHFIRTINISIVLLIFFSLFEFIFQINLFDYVRNSYLSNESRFSNRLGLVRLGRKSSMGPFASTLPFAYTLTCLFFLKDLYKPSYLNKKFKVLIFQVLGVYAIIFTLSRAAIFVLLFFIIIKNIFKKDLIKVAGFIIIFSSSLFFINTQINDSPFEKYIEKYIYNIVSDETAGTDLRVNNNMIDLKFAQESPLLGHGAGMLYHNKIDGYKLESSDSSFLITIFAERGIFSLAIFLIILLITLKRCLILKKISSKTFNYGALIFSYLSLILCLTSSQRQEVYFLFFLLLGLINKLYILNKKNVNIYNNSNI